MGKLVNLILLLLLWAPHLWASERIINVDFLGLVKVEETEARGYIHSKEGSTYSLANVRKDIKALYASGLFSDVQVESEPVADGLRIVFKVKEKGVVEAIILRGNKKIKDKDLKEVITQRTHQFVDDARLAESIQAIHKLYEEKGFYLADVTTETSPLDMEKNEVELIFNVKENLQVRIRRISFVGNKVFSDRNLTKQMKTKVKGTFSFVSGSGKYQDEKLQFDLHQLLGFYLDRGYLKAKIGTPQISLTKNRKALYITIPIHEGQKYKMNQVDVLGDIITTKEELLSKLKLKPGEIFNQSIVREDQTFLENFYGDQAYAFAAIYPEITSNDRDLTAQVIYQINKGKKIHIEKIIIKGNKVTRDKVIRREIQLLENAPYSRSRLELSKKRLLQLGFFESVNFATPRGSRDDRVDLIVEVIEKSTGSFSVGAGFSSLESFIFTASVQKENFFGYGIRGAASASLSKLRQEFSISMTDRYFLDTRWIFSASLFRLTSALHQDFDQSAFGGTVTFGREVFQFFDINLGYNIEDISVTNFSSSVPGFFQQNASGLTSSALTIFAYDTRDNRLLTSKGMYHAVTSKYAGNGIGGDNDFWKLSTESRLFVKLPLKTVLKFRGLFSYVNSLNNEPVPLFERFFMGGINTLRGYDFNTIGPVLQIPASATGGTQSFTFGGNRMLLANMEYELPIYDPAGIHFVLFTDTGQSFAEDEAIDLARLRSNYGFGLRWNSPFGPLRFEWGFPIKRRSGEAFTVFNFTIGQSF